MVWVWLVLLLIEDWRFSSCRFRAPPRCFIFSIAAIKAALVLRNYMHLKHEHLLIYLIVAIPALFVLGLTLSLIPTWSIATRWKDEANEGAHHSRSARRDAAAVVRAGVSELLRGLESSHDCRLLCEHDVAR